LAFADNVVLYDVAANKTSASGLNTIYFGLGGGPNSGLLVGQNISITTANQISPGLVLKNCIGCTLNFTSGAVSSYSPGTPGPFGGLPNQSWAFSSGGAASITGGVDLNENGILDAGDIAAGSNLLSGYFLNSPTVTSNPNSDLRVAAGLILNSQNTQLNQYFFGKPIAGPVWTGSLTLLFNPNGRPKPPGGTPALPTFISQTIISGSLVNSSPVPEPGSVLLFSSVTGFLGLGLMLRRRRANQTNS